MIMSAFGGGWQGGGWQGGGWQGGGWQGGGWQGGGGGGFPTFPMRADRPFADFAIQSRLGATYPDFPARLWDPDLWALSVLPEFFDPNLPHGPWEGRITVQAPAAITQPDIDRLLVLAVTERPEAMGEIIHQHQNFQVCFLQLLMIDANTHPYTFLLMKLAARVGETLMIHYKRKYHRPRPSQVCPTLFPPVPVPGHGSYPAGHALIAKLTSECLKELVPAVTHSALDELARRIGFNRAIAGLHYESDITAGADVGRQIHPILQECQAYQYVLAKAMQENF
jgi:acid phosphatase (class A)